MLCRLALLFVCLHACSNPIVEASASGRQGFNYLFYIDFVGALSNPNCQNALRHLQVSARVLVVRGMGVVSWVETNTSPLPLPPTNPMLLCRKAHPSCACWAATLWRRTWVDSTATRPLTASTNHEFETVVAEPVGGVIQGANAAVPTHFNRLYCGVTLPFVLPFSRWSPCDVEASANGSHANSSQTQHCPQHQLRSSLPACICSAAQENGHPAGAAGRALAPPGAAQLYPRQDAGAGRQVCHGTAHGTLHRGLQSGEAPHLP